MYGRIPSDGTLDSVSMRPFDQPTAANCLESVLAAGEGQTYPKTDHRQPARPADQLEPPGRTSEPRPHSAGRDPQTLSLTSAITNETALRTSI